VAKRLLKMGRRGRAQKGNEEITAAQIRE
jgi:hypothetical protein